MDELGKALQARDFNSMGFKLIGHTDVRGTDEYNDMLSLQRAESVKDYLIRRFNIASGRIEVEGKGRRQPWYRQNTEDAHALNRRVEVIVVSK